jgi:hypothetical protein
VRCVGKALGQRATKQLGGGCGVPANGLGTTIKYLRGAACTGLGVTIK